MDIDEIPGIHQRYCVLKSLAGQCRLNVKTVPRARYKGLGCMKQPIIDLNCQRPSTKETAHAAFRVTDADL